MELISSDREFHLLNFMYMFKTRENEFLTRYYRVTGHIPFFDYFLYNSL